MTRIDVRSAARRLRDGRVVAFPTETVYGLGANALDERAVGRIFVAKGRPSDNPLIVHISDERMLAMVAARVPAVARRLMRRFWPGPLSLVLTKHPAVPRAVTAGLETVAVRMPDHPVALALIRAAGLPIAAPSANRSGRPSPTTAAHVRADLPRVMVLDGGPCQHGLESTVVDLTGERPRVLRQGAITLEQLRAIIPGIRVARATGQRPASPGMKHRHYAPDVPLRVFATRASMSRYLRAHKGVRELMLPSDAASAARALYHALRNPPAGAREIVVTLYPESGAGRAVNDRLRRASQG